MQNNLTRLNQDDNENWDDVDNIQRQTPKPKHRKPRERIPVSVQKVITEVDEYIEGGNFLTEKKFRNLAQETKGMEKISHIQASLNEMAFWQSLCVPISR
jgi:hypothetical protein